MGLFSKLAEWAANVFGGGDDDGSTVEDGTGEADETDRTDKTDGPDGTGGSSDRLDPGAATERRAAATDDAVDALRDVRRSQREREADRSDGEPSADREAEADPGRS
ncbi:hypothetical protein C461_09009 [Halorubrum aidingense JCM 13560]|uniref:Uncharacterized protein n=1 Tax=Halorubrum aidingense JCM 13560 TaxID=1230454 RepID=M0PGF0_9EURY|nr:hypothetical protein [Halorubrum aidingense]EMA67855.1 hypothetical protein C461_09009 [Halorubrum aidingense JCM 13560]